MSFYFDSSAKYLAALSFWASTVFCKEQYISRSLGNVVLTVWKLGTYTNDITLMVEFVVEGCGLVPSLHSELVAIGNAGHSASGRCTVYAAREDAKVTG